MSTQPLVHSFNEKKITSKGSMSLGLVLGIIALAVLLGIGTGYGVSAFKGAASTTTKTDSKTPKGTTPKSAGVKDSKTFPDPAEGTLKEGGFEGEGSYHLVRPGGDDQNVYLTSTTVDLALFLDKKVRVLGQTFQSEKAGWLMDVGYIEVM